MKKILILRGLPASGKSTFAKQLIDRTPNRYKRVNTDELRLMVDNDKCSKDNEKQIISIRNAIIRNILTNENRVVIVDDTNFHQSHIDKLKEIGKELKAQVEIKDFDTSVEDCIKRDLQRSRSVGKDVIMNMYDRYVKPKPSVIEYDDSLDDCIIVDIDGTLAHMTSRSPFDWSRVGEDKHDLEIQLIIDCIQRGDDCIKLVLLSGRDTACRGETEMWLSKNGVDYDNLYMRADGDNRCDTIVKKELYERHIKGEYNVRFVLDDRKKVVNMWRNLGLKCFQVAEGNF